MANVYLIDKKFGNNSLRIAEQDKNAEIVLIQDGIYLDVKKMKIPAIKFMLLKLMLRNVVTTNYCLRILN